jgi:hypothetical protein
MAQDELNLSPDSRDKLTAAVRGLVGAVPVVGSIIGEVITNLIPNQRVDRIASFLAYLDERLAHVEHDELRRRLTSESNVDLLEDGLHQAARALSDDRRRQLAAVLAHSLTAAELRHAEQKRLLQIFGDLNDAEVLLLKSYDFRLPGRQEFLEKHQDILYPPVVTMGSPQPEIDAAAVRDSYKEHLLRLGLIEAVYRQPTPREPAEFDRHTGKLKSSYDNLTGLGSLLLDLIDDALPPVAA